MKKRTFFSLTAMFAVILAASMVPMATANSGDYSIYGDWIGQALTSDRPASGVTVSTNTTADLSIYGDAILVYMQGSGEMLTRAAIQCPTDYSIYGAALDIYLDYETVDTPFYAACFSASR